MSNVSPHTIEEIFSQTNILNYDKDQIIIHADDIPSGIFFVKSGVLKKTAILENGREITLRVYRPGSLFPLIWAFTDIDNYFYKTVTPVELQKLPRDAFVTFIRTHPDVLFVLMQQILLGEHELFTSIIHELSGDSYHRVVASLVLHTKRIGKEIPKKSVLKLSLTHQEIADITGLTRETVSLAILKLKKKKIIGSYNHIIVIKNFDALQKESTFDDSTLTDIRV